MDFISLRLLSAILVSLANFENARDGWVKYLFFLYTVTSLIFVQILSINMTLANHPMVLP